MSIEEFRADRLRAFVAVARAGGFTRAARRLGRSQSSVSQAVGLLEQELGEALLVRDGRTVHVTAAGRVLLGHAERVFSELEEARAELAALRELRTGSLSLGTTDTLAIYALPGVFAAFRARYPRVEVQLLNRPSPALAEHVARREVDVAVASLPLPPGLRLAGRPLADQVRIEPLVAQRDVFICPPDHELAGRRHVALRALAGQPLVLLDRSTATRALLDERLAAAGIEPRVVMEMNSVEVVKRLVELRFGVSIVPEMAAAPEVAGGTLAAVAIRGLGRERQVGILTPTTGPLSRAARAFVELAREQLKVR